MGGGGIFQSSGLDLEIDAAAPVAGQGPAGGVCSHLGLRQGNLGLGDLSVGAGTGEQRVAGCLHSSINLALSARGHLQPIARQTNPGLGRQGFDPGQFDLQKKVQNLGLMAQANQVDLGAR